MDRGLGRDSLHEEALAGAPIRDGRSMEDCASAAAARKEPHVDDQLRSREGSEQAAVAGEELRAGGRRGKGRA